MAKATKVDPEVVRTVLPTDAIVPDPANRRIVEDDDFEALCDSIRVLGVLQPPHVVRQEDGTHRLIDGERRWRAAVKVGLVEIPCEVWPEDADRGLVGVAGIVLNEHRRAHGCLHVARRLRDMKNEHGLTHKDLAGRTGLPLDRIKTYFSLFGASDFVLTFLEEHELPVKVAVELVRYEKATNEACARRLAAKYLESPLTSEEIATLRKRQDKTRRDKDAPPSDRREERRQARVFDALEAEMRREPSSALRILEEMARRLGYRLVPEARPDEARS